MSKRVNIRMRISKKIRLLGLAVGIGLSAMLAGCSGGESAKSKQINLAYVEWDTEVASTSVIGKVLEDIGYDVQLTPLDNAIMWEAVANGEADAMVAGWLPNTHAAQYEKYKGKLEDLGTNFKGAKVGLVVPKYMDVNSIEDLKLQANGTITGIEPGAGVVATAEKAVKKYDNLTSWNVKTSSSGAMTVALGKAIKDKEDIVITGWSPHWMFKKYDLKYLKDPKGVFGKEEAIHTFARKDLEKDQPEAYKVLKRFNWTANDIEEVMLKISNGEDPEDAAEEWIKKNQDKVNSWTKGIDKK